MKSLFFVCALVLSLSVGAQTVAPPEIAARSYLLLDLASGQVLAQNLQAGLQGNAQAAATAAAAQAAATLKPDDVIATLEKLGDLKAKGILTDEEFAAKKAELLKKLA